jgi:Ca-activated chloride channel family protein
MSKPNLCGMLVVSDDRFVPPTRSIPLTGVKVGVAIQGPASRVRVVQSYENREATPLEAVYVFPLEEGSAVCGFAVTLDGQRLEGKVLERDAAFDEYDDAMAEGHGAFLLDQDRPNIFTASVGNLMPGQQVDVEVTYVAELEREGPALRLMVPGTVSPRYVARDQRDFEGLTDAERVNPPVTTQGLPYSLELAVEADLLTPVRSVESPSHKIRSEIDGTRVRVSLSGDEGRLDRDFVLLLTPAEPLLPLSCQAQDRRGDRFALASFTPQIPDTKVPVEVLFLVDCSGSMDGPSIVEARRTLRLCLHSLEPGDRFEIVRFGSSHQGLFGESREYDDDALEAAARWVERLQADLGGTEILAPLNELLALPATRGVARRVVLLTDGQVTNEDRVIDLVRKHRRTTQVYAFGIGHGASEFLVRGVARASRGAAEFVHPGERLEDKVLRHFRRLKRSSASRVRLDWEGLDVADVTPSEVPPLFPGETLTFLARVTGGDAGRAWMNGEVEGQGVLVEAPIAPLSSEHATDDLLAVLWARRRIRELEELGWTDRHGSLQEDRRRAGQHEEERIREELVSLGTRYGLLSSATSYMVVEERPKAERATERAVLRRIPVALTRGWGGIQDEHASFGVWEDHDFMMPRELPSIRHEQPLHLSPRQISPDPSAPARFLRAVVPPPDMPQLELLLSQNADGSWDLDQRIAERCGTNLSDLERAAIRSGHPEGARVLATLLVLLLLDRDDAATREAWRPVIEKGVTWLSRNTADVEPPTPHPDWTDWAEQFV